MVYQDDNEFVTFVLPCLNEEKTLEKCILEIREVINKIDRPASILVSDNGSTDNSRLIADMLGVNVIEVVNPRIWCCTRIQGCSVASGKYIVIGDSDGSYDFSEFLRCWKSSKKVSNS